MKDDDLGKTEPSADMRSMAKSLRETFVALRLEGFTENQAIAIIGQMLASIAPPPDQNE